jgi:3-hydroxybutyryl-CoA dehydratase
MGLYFDEIAADHRFTSAGRTITEADVTGFAELTGDFTAFHLDEDYAKQTMFGRRIAHGALVFSISLGLSTRLHLTDDTLLALAGVDRLRFVQPVFIGDTVQVAKRVIERREIDEARGAIVFESKVTNQDGRTVLIYHDKLLFKRVPPAQ